MKNRVKLITMFIVSVFSPACLFGENTDKQLIKDVHYASEYFAAHYSQCYISKAVMTKEIKSGDTYQGFLAMSCLWGSTNFNQKSGRLYFYDENHMGNYLPLDVLSTDFIVPGTDKVCEKRVVTSVGKTAFDKMITGYSYDLDQFILLRKRALEIYGPLNGRFHKSYRFEKAGSSLYGGDIVRFASLIDTFSDNMRIYCPKGNIHLDSQKRVRKVEVWDMEDRYSFYIRSNSDRMPFAVDCYYSVSYEWLGDVCVTSYVEQKVNWKMPADKDAKYYYYPEFSPYRNPFKYDISSVQKIFFSDFVMLKNSDILDADDDDLVLLAYVQDTNYDYWKKELRGKVPFEQIEKELSRSGKSVKAQNEVFVSSWLDRLYNDAVETQWPEYDIQPMIERNKKRSAFSRELYKELYSKPYDAL